MWVVTDVELCGWLLLRSQVCVDSGCWRVVWVVTVTESGLCWLRWLKGCVGGYCYGVRSVLTQVAEGLCGWLLLRSQVCVDSGGWRVVWVVTVTESGLCWLRWLKGCVGGYCYGVRSVLTQVAEGLCGWLLLRSQVCVDSGGWRVTLPAPADDCVPWHEAWQRPHLQPRPWCLGEWMWYLWRVDQLMIPGAEASVEQGLAWFKNLENGNAWWASLKGQKVQGSSSLKPYWNCLRRQHAEKFWGVG